MKESMNEQKKEHYKKIASISLAPPGHKRSSTSQANVTREMYINKHEAPLFLQDRPGHSPNLHKKKEIPLPPEIFQKVEDTIRYFLDLGIQVANVFCEQLCRVGEVAEIIHRNLRFHNRSSVAKTPLELYQSRLKLADLIYKVVESIESLTVIGQTFR